MALDAIYDGLNNLLNGPNAVLGILSVIATHFYRMKFSRVKKSGRPNSYRHCVIAPYTEVEGRSEPMTPAFKRAVKLYFVRIGGCHGARCSK